MIKMIQKLKLKLSEYLMEYGYNDRRRVKYKSNEEGMVYDLSDAPFIRGKLHLLLAVLSPIWFSYLWKYCNNFNSKIAVVVTAVCAVSNFLSSGIFHSFRFSPKITKSIHQADLMGIFLMIGGSSSPIVALLLEGPPRVIYLTLQWAPSIAGIVLVLFSNFSKDTPAKRSLFYIFIGALQVTCALAVIFVLTSFEVLMSISLASSYVIGACIYALGIPRSPIFGHHEIFHLFCFLSAIFTFMLNASVLQRVG